MLTTKNLVVSFSTEKRNGGSLEKSLLRTWDSQGLNYGQRKLIAVAESSELWDH